jgi:MFS transporter, FHS family, glucose/mannose:H+ symporter
VPQAASRFEVGLLYAAGVVQGLTLVTFPAASTIFVSPTAFGLSGTQYGAMFVPQVVLAILASALGSALAKRIGLRGVLLTGLGCDLLSMFLLGGSSLVMGKPAAFVTLCAATGALGFGFGATVMALNTLVEGFFPEAADAAVLTLNALLGVGTALAPLLVALFTWVSMWWGLPVLMCVLLIALLAVTARQHLHSPYASQTGTHGIPSRFWIYAAAVLLYGVAETLSGNWATIYLSSQRGLSIQDASFALTSFWIMVTVGRLLVAVLQRVVSSRWIYLALPILMVAAFQLAATADTTAFGIIGFGAVGLACSAFLPLSISFGGGEFPRQAAFMSGALIAFYQVGYGIAAFGVGPLRQIAGLDYGSVISAGSIVAIILVVAAALIIRHHHERSRT